MNDKALRSWWDMGIETWSLGADATYVAGLRLVRIATGSVDAVAETQRMVSEKMQAALELQADAALGKLGATPLSSGRSVLKYYRRMVAANRRRLSR